MLEICSVSLCEGLKRKVKKLTGLRCGHIYEADGELIPPSFRWWMTGSRSLSLLKMSHNENTTVKEGVSSQMSRVTGRRFVNHFIVLGLTYCSSRSERLVLRPF
jgi:hypothetical protein